MKNIKPSIVGLLQAIGLTVYVIIFALFTQVADRLDILPKYSPVVGVALFLLIFIISALICSSLILGYPIVLFFTGHRRRALQIVVWSACWLIVIALIVFCFTLSASY